MIHAHTPVCMLAALLASAALAQDNVGHTRHHHPHNPKHPAAPDHARFHTSRTGATLPLPNEEDAFFFVVFGDRTGGPDEGVAVLADAVRDTNLLEPDLVMTVGDLVQGYNQEQEWMAQMREYKQIMDHLICPWFPVAGNHDVYWRGPEGQKPEGEHEKNYEIHFGPLWYAFEHKNCWFIALYSDEGNPETGEKNFEKPACQVMSQEQYDWLKDTLEKAKDADHVFLFLHHPRWLGRNYGGDWERVHKLLAAAGNVSAVFAGHIHHMRYDGPRDGIEYVTLATVGGYQNGKVPEVGWLHHFHTVTVRKDQIAMAALPVGEVMDVREITGALVAQAERLVEERPGFERALPVASDGSAEGVVRATVWNPIELPIDLTVRPECGDSRWLFEPDHDHARLEPGESRQFVFHASRLGDVVDQSFRLPDLVIEPEILARGFRYAIPQARAELPLDAELIRPSAPAEDMALSAGEGRCAQVGDASFQLPDGPFTLECWFNADRYDQRTGLVCKTEDSDYGIFVNDGRPSFSVFLGNGYVEAESSKRTLTTGRWHHIAGVYDGAEVRLYVDGRLVASKPGAGERRTNTFPLIIGADVDGRGRPTSPFRGRIDAVRLSRNVRYTGEVVQPPRRTEADADTMLLFNMDALVGPWIFDESRSSAHARLLGQAELTPAGSR